MFKKILGIFICMMVLISSFSVATQTFSTNGEKSKKNNYIESSNFKIKTSEYGLNSSYCSQESNDGENNEMAELFSITYNENIYISKNGKANINLSINIPKSNFCDSYRENLGVKNNQKINRSIPIPERKIINSNGKTILSSGREGFHNSIFQEQWYSLGILTEISNSEIIPFDTKDGCKIDIEGSAFLKTTDFDNNVRCTAMGSLAIENKTSYSKYISSVVGYTKLMLNSFPGKQIFKHKWNTKIQIPKGAQLLNKNELDGLNWKLNFNGGTILESKLILKNSSILLKEEITITEDSDVNPTPIGDYKSFEIRYASLSSSNKSPNENISPPDTSVLWEDDIFSWSKTYSESWNDSNGYVTVDFSVYFEATATVHLDLEKAWIKPQFHANASFDIIFTAGVNYEPDPLEIFYKDWWPSFWLGPVFVTIHVEASIELRFKFEAEASVTAHTGLTIDAWFKAGAQYSLFDGFSTIWDSGFEKDFQEPTIDGSAKISIRPALAFPIKAKIYGLIGPEVTPELFLEGVMKYTGSLFWYVRIGLCLDVGVCVGIPYVWDESWSWEIADWTIFKFGSTTPSNDNESPITTLIMYSPPLYKVGDEWWTGKYLYFWFTSLDQGYIPSGVDYTKFKVNGNPWMIYGYPDIWCAEIDEDPGYYSYNINWYSIDNFGHQESTKSYTVNAELYPPTSQITIGNPHDGNHVVYNQTVITLTAQDDLTGWKIWYRVWHEDDGWSEWYNHDEITPVSFMFTDQAQGNCEVEWCAVDGVWNFEDVHSQSFYVDKIPSACYTWEDNDENNDETLINFDASCSTDDYGIIDYKWDWTNDGSYDHTDSDPYCSHDYYDTEIHECRLLVEDEYGQINTIIQNVQASTSVDPDWAMFQHDLSNTGYSSSTAPGSDAVVKWKYDVDYFARSSPAIVDDKLFIGYESIVHENNFGELLCIDVNDGSLLWKYYTDEGILSSPAVVDGRVYFGSIDKNVYCLNAQNGNKIWSFPTNEGVWSSPAIYDNKVYIGSDDGFIYCLNAISGSLVWKKLFSNEVEFTPAISYGNVYVSSGGTIYCLDADNGNTIWNKPLGGCSPTVVDGKIYIESGFSEEKFYCLNANNGNIIWEYPLSNSVSSFSAATYNGKVYFGSFDHKLYCLNADTGDFLWKFDTSHFIYSAPAIADGKVFFGSCDNKIYCLDADNGNQIWSHNTGSMVESSPAIYEGKVFIGSSGFVYCFGNNLPPELSLYDGWTDGVDPNEAEEDETFTFKVHYSDPEGYGPSDKKVIIDGTEYSMSGGGGDSDFTLTKTGIDLGVGTHEYYFYFKDPQGGSDRLPNSGTWSFKVNPKQIFPPSVETRDATDVDSKNAQLNGKIIYDGDESCQIRFRYKEETDSSWIYPTDWTGEYRTGQVFDKTIHDLNPSTTYNFQAGAKNSNDESWGETLSFTTKQNTPPKKPDKPNGPSSGKPGVEYQFKTKVTDDEQDKVYFIWDIGGATTTRGPFNSGEQIIMSLLIGNGLNGEIEIKVRAKDTWGAYGPYSEPVTFYVSNPPNKPQKPLGPVKGAIKTEYTYSVSTTEPDNEDIYYLFDWGDGTDSGWIGPYKSGEIANASNSWDSKKDYNVKVKAKDNHGVESEWSDSLVVSMPKTRGLNNILQSILEKFFGNHPILYKIFQRIIRL